MQELKYRQQLFQDTKRQLDVATVDMDAYQHYYREALVKKPLAHLFLIADEFAELKTQQPQFMEQLKQAARIGRSLGILWYWLRRNHMASSMIKYGAMRVFIYV